MNTTQATTIDEVITMLEDIIKVSKEKQDWKLFSPLLPDKADWLWSAHDLSKLYTCLQFAGTILATY